MIEKGRKSDDSTYENRLFTGCATGVTRTPDPRIRNPLLYPAELRAQNAKNISPWNRKNPAPMRADLMDVRVLWVSQLTLSVCRSACVPVSKCVYQHGDFGGPPSQI